MSYLDDYDYEDDDGDDEDYIGGAAADGDCIFYLIY